MDSNKGGILNRLGDHLLNWQFIEEIEFSGAEKAIIYFTSGRDKLIKDRKMVEKLKDLIQIFPDIANDETRMMMKQQAMSPVQTDINDRKYPAPRNAVKTDIAE